jgi:peroxiredoxin
LRVLSFALATTLLAQDATDIGLPTGTIAPDFTLSDQVGQKQTLSSLMGERGLVLVFFRSADWCVFCKTQLMQLEADRVAVKQAGYGMAAISYDSAAILRDFAARKKIIVPLLSDHDSTVIRDYRVDNRKFRKTTQIDVEREVIHESSFAYTPVYGIAYPSVFVIDSSGKIVWRFASERDELRLTGASILDRAVQVPTTANRTMVRSGQFDVMATASNRAAAMGNRIVLAVEMKLPPGMIVFRQLVCHFYG